MPGSIQENVLRLRQTLAGISKVREDYLKLKAPESKKVMVFGAPAIYVQESTTPAEKNVYKKTGKKIFASQAKELISKYKEGLPKVATVAQAEVYARRGDAPKEVIEKWREQRTEGYVDWGYLFTELLRAQGAQIQAGAIPGEAGPFVPGPQLPGLPGLPDLFGGLKDAGKWILIGAAVLGGLYIGGKLIGRKK